MRHIEVALRSYQRSHKIPIPVSAYNQPTRVENRPKNTNRLYFVSWATHLPGCTVTVLYHQTPQPRFHSPDATAMVSSTPQFNSLDTTATVSFTRRHSHGFIYQKPQPWFHSPDTTATVYFTRYYSHGFICQQKAQGS